MSNKNFNKIARDLYNSITYEYYKEKAGDIVGLIELRLESAYNNGVIDTNQSMIDQLKKDIEKLL